MRTHNNSRLPNLALIGLLVAVALLAYSYWNASMKNANLSLELEESIAKLKSEQTKRIDLGKRLDAMDQKLKEYISDLDKEKLHLKTTEKEHDLCRADLSNAQHEYELAKNDASVCQNKMAEDGDIITSLKQEKDVIQAHLDKCEADIDSERSGRVQDKQQATTDCDRKVDDLRLTLLGHVKDATNVDVLLALQQRGVDVSGISLERPPPLPNVPDRKQGGSDQQQLQMQGGNDADANVGGNKRGVYQPAAGDDRQGGASANDNRRVDGNRAAASDSNANNNGRQKIDFNNNNNYNNNGNNNVDNRNGGVGDTNKRSAVDDSKNYQQPPQPVAANAAADQMQNNNNNNNPQQLAVDTRNVVANNNDRLMPNNDQSALNAGAANQQTYRRSGEQNGPIVNNQQLPGSSVVSGIPSTPAVPVQPQGNNNVLLQDNNDNIRDDRQQQQARGRFDPPAMGAAAVVGGQGPQQPPAAGAGLAWQPAALPGALNANNGVQQAVVAAPAGAEGAAAAPPIPAQQWQLDNNGQQQPPQLRMPPAPAGDNSDRSALGQAQPLPVNVPRGQDYAAPVGAAAAAPGGDINLQVAPPAVVPALPDVKDKEDAQGIRADDTNTEADAEDNADGDNDRLEAVRKDKAGEGAGVEDNGPDAKKDEDDYEADGNKGQPPARP